MSNDPDTIDQSFVRDPDEDHSPASLEGVRHVGITERLRGLWRTLRGTDVGRDTYRFGRDRPIAAFDAPPGEEEIDRYWVNAPFSFVAITESEDENALQYHAVEPTLDASLRAILETLVDDIRDPLVYGEEIESADSFDPILMRALSDRLDRYGVVVDTADYYTLYYYLRRTFRGFGKIDPIMHDPHVEDVSCDGYDVPLFVYHDRYADLETNVTFAEETLDSFVVRLAQQSGRHISVGEPILEATLPEGSRAELALGREVTPRGSAFTIRKYSVEPFTPIDLLRSGTYDLDQLAYLWLAIESNKSLIFAGGTASGKTTSMNAMSMFIPPRAKVISIEDTQELLLHHRNWLSSVTRERLHAGADISMYDLLRSSLRHRPEYIIVGEVRGEEAITLFQAMNTGHTTYSTLHADSVQTVINRLENEPINVPRAMIESLDILCVQVLTRVDGERVRRAKTIAEIEGQDARTGELDYTSAWEWDPAADRYRGDSTAVVESIRAERGWTQAELLAELADRREFLRALHEEAVTDFRRFTALINEYYADPDRAMARLDLDRRRRPDAVADLD